MKNPYQQMTAQYKALDLETTVMEASPHALISLLLDGVQKNIELAKNAMDNNQIAKKAECISKSIHILTGLRTSLNIEKGDAIAENLDKLYEYMQACLFYANLKNDKNKLDEVITLLTPIQSAWKAITESANA
jgi:flagellar protein FliS